MTILSVALRDGGIVRCWGEVGNLSVYWYTLLHTPFTSLAVQEKGEGGGLGPKECHTRILGGIPDCKIRIEGRYGIRKVIYAFHETTMKLWDTAI